MYMVNSRLKYERQYSNLLLPINIQYYIIFFLQKLSSCKSHKVWATSLFGKKFSQICSIRMGTLMNVHVLNQACKIVLNR